MPAGKLIHNLGFLGEVMVLGSPPVFEGISEQVHTALRVSRQEMPADNETGTEILFATIPALQLVRECVRVKTGNSVAQGTVLLPQQIQP